MDGLVDRLSPVLHLTRITNAVAAVANVWFVALWTRAFPAEAAAAEGGVVAGSLAGVLVGGAVLAVGLFAYAMALNDTLDLRRDRALHPERPLPSGRLSVDTAVALMVSSLIAACLGAAALGMDSVVMCLVVAAAVLVFDGLGKHVPSVGLVLLGLIYAGHMMIPNVRLIFLWPVWVAMTHALAVGALTHWLAARRPALRGRTLAIAGLGWVFWSSVLLWVGLRRGGDLWPVWASGWSAVWILALAGAYGWVAWWKVRRSRSRARAAEKVQRYGSLWLTLYATAWMVGSARWTEALILGGLATVGFIGMTVLREAYSLLEHPVGYRRA
jgi:hypothetical protein